MTNREPRTLDLLDTAPAESVGCGCGGCDCGTSSSADASHEPKRTAAADQTTSTYAVTGMTCGHCASSVTTELKALDGVTDVSVDLVAGGTSTVTVTSTRSLEDSQVAAALDEAGGYHLA